MAAILDADCSVQSSSDIDYMCHIVGNKASKLHIRNSGISRQEPLIMLNVFNIMCIVNGQDANGLKLKSNKFSLKASK